MLTGKGLEQTAQIAAIVVLVIGCLFVLQPFITALLSAAILCFSTWPIYLRLEQLMRGKSWLAALTITLVIVLLLVLPLALIARAFVDEVPGLVERGRELVAEGLPLPPDWVAGIPLVGDSLDAAWRDLVASRSKLNEALLGLVKPAREILVKTGIIIGEGVLQFTLIAFISFFFYRDGAALVQATRNGLNRIAGGMTVGLMETVGDTINSVVYGIIGTALAQGLAALVGFLLAGVPGALLLGFLTSLLSLVPAGPPLIWIGATVWLFYQDQLGWAAFMAIWGFFVVSGIDNVVKPMLISRGSSLPFILVLIGVFGGVLAFGFVGIFLGPTLLAVGFNLVRKWTAQAEGSPAAPGA
ncbi:MAG: AI-2E family transporter [Betaproteobacteria bacterium RIFCSPLOWO2_12_FULL_62_13]|nr:MAG: AI-2E family transporter [Betaproteobacteria bacterium RIFCSPLOWO2_12_FULL_62_13]